VYQIQIYIFEISVESFINKSVNEITVSKFIVVILCVFARGVEWGAFCK